MRRKVPVGLLAAPLVWLGVAYLGALAMIFATAFFTTDSFTGAVVRDFSLENYREVLSPTYGGIILRTVLIAAAVTLRVPRARPLLTVGGPLVLAASVAYLVGHQYLDHLPAGFDWPTYFEAVQQPAWTAVALVALDPIVDRCWLRRWWPSDNSPE